MRFVSVVLLLALAVTPPASAASYQTTEGEVVDPIGYAAIFGGGVHPYTGPNLEPAALLTGAALSGADLRFAALADADLSGASIDDAILDFADLPGAHISPGNLTGTSMEGADLSQADLSGANLVLADLRGASLSGAILDAADFNTADLTGANLTAASLTGANLHNAAYDELTLMPSGLDIFSGDWGLPDDATPWALGMIPMPEPTTSVILCVGSLALAMARRRRP